ncbi:MAG: SIR2 family protein [Selenomonas sp.]|nr:SIR2 family protein [Selenomonas sp.]
MQKEHIPDGKVLTLSELSDTVWRAIFEKKAILFLGAGFSLQTSSVTGEPLVTANDLKPKLGELAGLDKDVCEKHDLMKIGTHVAKHHKDEMVEFLRKTFTVHETGSVQRNLVNQEWQRIYTTNYDNVVETAAAEMQRVLEPVVFSDEMPQKKDDICIHINGSVKNLNNSTLQSEFKLISKSYRNEDIVKSPWYSFMVDDFRVASQIVVVGYSMNSDHIINVLFGSPAMRKKLLFIQPEGLDPIDIDSFTDYGNLVMCGAEQFSMFLTEQKASYQAPVSSHRREDFICFNHSYRVVSEVSPLSFDDYVRFYFYGELKQAFFQKKTTGEYKALASRHPLHSVLRNRESGNVFLVTAALGNGKTIFCEILRHELMETDTHVFFFTAKRDGVEDEIREICRAYEGEPCFVVMDDVYRNLDILRIFKLYDMRHITFLLTTRSSLASRVYDGIRDVLGKNGKQIHTISLQSLSSDECYEMAAILQSQNLLSSHYEMARWPTNKLAVYFEKKDQASIGQILLDVFDKSVVKDHMEELIRGSAEEDSEFRDLLIGLLASAVWDLGLDSTMVFVLLDFDRARAFGTKEQEVLLELFIDQNMDSYRPISSIFANAVLFKVFRPQEIMGTMERMARGLQGVSNTDDSCKSAMKAILSHGNYKRMISSAEGRVAIHHFYDSLRELSWYKENSFYWEEFALSYIDQKEYDSAEMCLGTAESKAKANPRFQPFQLMTIKADCHLSRMLDDSTYAEIHSPIDIIQESVDFLLRYENHPSNDKNYISAVSRKCVEVYYHYRDSFGTADKARYISCMNRIARRLQKWREDAWNGRLMEETLQDIEESMKEAKENRLRR